MDETITIAFVGHAAYVGYLADGRRRALIGAHGEVFTSKAVVELDTIAGATG